MPRTPVPPALTYASRMSIRIHFEGMTLAAGQTIRLPEAAFRHLVQVLRLKPGERFVAFDGRGGEYEAELTAVARRDAEARLLAFIDADRESPLDLTLAQCVSKGERMDYTLQKAVELGVTRIVPLLSSRSVVRLDAERTDKKLEHWRGIVASACEQSGRTRLPAVAEIVALPTWLDDESAPGTRLTLDPQGHHSLHQLPQPNGPVTLLVGPEGGLSDHELDRARAAGFTGIRMGPRVLRTETAGVAALAALQALWGDWR
ncbi:MAG: 16S rRNA (uracil(1498)-N(3))-methyltransferase [Solimonas sp.]